MIVAYDEQDEYEISKKLCPIVEEISVHNGNIHRIPFSNHTASNEKRKRKIITGGPL